MTNQRSDIQFNSPDLPYQDRVGLIYVRVSSKKQELEGSGRESQETRCRAHLASIGVPVERTFPDTFSGGGDFMKRPAMRDLLAHVDANPHKKYVVVFDDLKRFARDTEFHLKLRSAFKIRNLLPRCLNYNFDDSPEGMFVETILAAGNELERHQNRRQVVQKMRARLESGYWAFGRKRGYTLTKDRLHHKLAVANDDAQILTAALEGFATGTLARKIDVARLLTEGGFWKNRAAARNIDNVSALLKDPFYAGFIEYPPWGIERRPGRHQALISVATFEAIQSRLEAASAAAPDRKDASEDFPMRGLVLCPCGKPYTAAYSKGRSKRYPYYLCQNKGCVWHGKSIPRRTVEDSFVSVLERGKLKKEIGAVVADVFDAVWKQEIANVAERDRRHDRKVGELRAQLEELTDLAAKAQSDRVRAVYEQRIEQVALTIERTEAQINRPPDDLQIPYRTALEKAVKLVESPYSVWKNLASREKRSLYFLLFGERIVYAKNEGYRTAKTPTTASLFEEFVHGSSGDVDIAGKTLNRLTFYLCGFWTYYKSCEELEEILHDPPERLAA